MDVKRLYIVGYLSDVMNTIMGIYETYEDAQDALQVFSKTYAATGSSTWNHGLYITAAHLYPNTKRDAT